MRRWMAMWMIVMVAPLAGCELKAARQPVGEKELASYHAAIGRTLALRSLREDYAQPRAGENEGWNVYEKPDRKHSFQFSSDGRHLEFVTIGADEYKKRYGEDSDGRWKHSVNPSGPTDSFRQLRDFFDANEPTAQVGRYLELQIPAQELTLTVWVDIAGGYLRRQIVSLQGRKGLETRYSGFNTVHVTAPPAAEVDEAG